MQKELNPELFVSSQSGGFNNSLVIHSEHEVAQLRQQLSHLTDLFGKMTIQIQEQIKNQNLNHRQLQHTVIHLDERERLLENKVQSLLMEFEKEKQNTQQKIEDKKKIELKMQEMLDRHQMIVKSYETNINQLKKIIAEKEAQILQTQLAFNEIKKEIQKLKKL